MIILKNVTDLERSVINMNREYIRKAAHCFRTDEKTIEKFIHDFFAAPDFDSALKVIDDFLDTHANSTTKEELNDFCTFLKLDMEDLQ